MKKIVNIDNIIFAYEPVWSIGTGKIPSNIELSENLKCIKSIIRSKYKRSKNINILYGGSVNPQNISDLKKIINLDGFLIGGASQSPKKFIDIVKKTYN